MTYKLFTCYLPLFALAFGCQESANKPVAANGELKISMIDGKANSNLEPDQLISFAQKKLLAASVSNSLLESGQVIEAHIEQSGNYFYLISHFKESERGEIIDTAIEIKPLKEGMYKSEDSQTEIHTCSGINDCQTNDFLKKEGKIIGCTCEQAASKKAVRNHSITQI